MLFECTIAGVSLMTLFKFKLLAVMMSDRGNPSVYPR